MADEYENCLGQIVQIEKETFSDAWSIESLRETLKYDYNMIITVIFDSAECRDGYVSVQTRMYRQGQIIHMKENIVNLDLGIAFSNQCVGYIVASFVAGESELLRIATKEGQRGCGIGKMLLEYYLEYLNSHDCRGLLEVRQSNLVARGLYEKYGYKDFAKRRLYYKAPEEDGIIYEYVPKNNR